MAQINVTSQSPLTVEIIFDALEMRALQERVEHFPRSASPIAYVTDVILGQITRLVQDYKDSLNESLKAKFEQIPPEQQAVAMAAVSATLDNFIPQGD